MSLQPPSSDPRPASAPGEPLGAHQLEERLDEALEPVLSSRRTAQPLALRLAPLERELQDFTLHWVGVIARTSSEMAYQFAALAPDALRKFDLVAAEAWIIHAMDTFDREGLYRASSELKDLDAYIAAFSGMTRAVAFEDACNVLGFFICGLSGRRLKLEAGTEAYTDTETIHLPACSAEYASREKNFTVYKAMATHLWAQTRYGTFNVEPAAKLASYADPGRALALFNYLETLRIDAIIARELPGLAREIAALDNAALPPHACRRVLELDATAADSLALVAVLYDNFTLPRLSYMGAIHPERVQAVRAARIAREKLELQSELAGMLAERSAAGQAQSAAGRRFAVDRSDPADAGGNLGLSLDGEPVALTEHGNDLLQSIAQDLGEIPDDYLVPAGDGAYRDSTTPGHKAADVWQGTYHEVGAVLYPEWDYRRRHYRKHWCVLRELDVHPGNPDFIAATLARYAPQVTRLRRTFELLRGEDKLLKKQQHGDDIDLDAVI